MTIELQPEPVPTHVKCSVCELPWPDHEKLGTVDGEITLLSCVRLLQAELAKRPTQRTYGNPSPFDGLLAAGGQSGSGMSESGEYLMGGQPVGRG